MGKVGLAESEEIIFSSDPQAWAKHFCPFSFKNGVGAFCLGSDCEIFIKRFSKWNPNKIVFAGCSLKWSALCVDRI